MDTNTMDPNPSTSKGYALSGKIMMSAIVILFFVVILMVCLHLYARWYLLRARRRHHRRVRQRRTHLVFYVDHDDPNNPAHVAVPARGLDSNVLKALPVFVFDPKTYQDPVECAVCLSEFEENETGRVLPKCNHSFHIECIDMWFHSHSTCPLCRSPVEPVENPTNGSTDSESRSEFGSELCDTCQNEIAGPSTSAKPVELVGITIEVPTRSGFGNELNESPASQSLRSPMSRMLSFTRILSRDRRASLSPTSCSELDVESNGQTHGGIGGINN